MQDVLREGSEFGRECYGISYTISHKGTIYSKKFAVTLVELTLPIAAEDNELNAEILRETLKIHGAACTICADGAALCDGEAR